VGEFKRRFKRIGEPFKRGLKRIVSRLNVHIHLNGVLVDV